MKAVTHTMKASLQWPFLALGMLLIFVPPSRAQTQVYSDDQLVTIGNDAYVKRDYISASLFLFAYIQKNPALMTSNPDFASSVQRNYQYSRDQVWSAWNERSQFRSQLRQQDAASNEASTSAGLTQPPPPPLKIPSDAHRRGLDKVQ